MFLFQKVVLLMSTLSTTQGNLTDSLWGWNNHSNGIYGNVPQPRRYQKEINSACAGDMQSESYGFSCPHMMLMSADMSLAASYDNNDKDFIYATAGTSTDNKCGSCYQVELIDAEIESQEGLAQKQLIIQVINSGFDIFEGQFDVYMGAGGFGYYTAANADCQINYCQGGPCRDHMYSGNFSQWTNTVFYDRNACYSGGIKWLDHTNPLIKMCKQAVNFEDSLKDRILVDSCVQSNSMLYHQNFLSTKYLNIKCPEGLYRLTGLKRQDEDNLPSANVSNELTNSCTGSKERGIFCYTTMCDMCKPSCSWLNKGNPDILWAKVDTCNRDGLLYDYY